jgi:hypothetical protein
LGQKTRAQPVSRREIDDSTDNPRSTFTLIEPVAQRPSQLNGIVW